jgi:hypothetical protein
MSIESGKRGEFRGLDVEESGQELNTEREGNGGGQTGQDGRGERGRV